ncbi:hypothetical protein PAMA_002599 [Pampus argenteus]
MQSGPREGSAEPQRGPDHCPADDDDPGRRMRVYFNKKLKKMYERGRRRGREGLSALRATSWQTAEKVSRGLGRECATRSVAVDGDGGTEDGGRRWVSWTPGAPGGDDAGIEGPCYIWRSIATSGKGRPDHLRDMSTDSAPRALRGHRQAPVLNGTPDYLIVLLDIPSSPLYKDCITSSSPNLSKPICSPIILSTDFTMTPPHSPPSTNPRPSASLNRNSQHDLCNP